MQNEQQQHNQEKVEIHETIKQQSSRCPILPGQYLHYQAPFKMFWQTKNLFKQLFLNWKTCLMCILKIYSVQYPKMYPDSQFLAFMLKNLLITCNNNQSQQTFFTKYNPTQKIYDCQNCWLCEQVMQQNNINNLIKTALSDIKEKHYDNYQKYKLNIKVPLVFTLKYYFVCMYLWEKFSQTNQNKSKIQVEENYYKVNETELNLIEKVLKSPYDKLTIKSQNNPILELKVILKWLISYQINRQTPLQSTIQQLQDMVTINIEHEYHNQNMQNHLMQLFNHLVGLEKKQRSKHHNKLKDKPEKKVKIDLVGMNQEDDHEEIEKIGKKQEFKCIANNVNKILYVKFEEMRHILHKFQNDQAFLKIFKANQDIELNNKVKLINSSGTISRTIKLQTKNICFSGKYCKYSRYISQTPWMVNGVKLTEGSLQQQIQDQILHYFYPNVPKNKIQTKFHSGGRQDIDVRMLKGGRPFVLELVNPILRPQYLSLQKIIEDSKLTQSDKKQILLTLPETTNKVQKICYVLENIVNKSTQLVQIKDFQQADESYISIELKKAEIQKIKHYVCYIVSHQELTQSDIQKVEKIQDLELDQKTPLRVLHRRTLMIRKKMIHKMYLHLVTKHSAVLELWASAGTYIKQFVHGDVERTLPNIGSLLCKKIDILQLDVGSLKQGNWQKGDDLKMRMDSFEWKN